MDDISVIDRFTETFIRYIDSGFGLLGGEVAFLTSVLVAIDITLAFLFWTMDGEADVIARLIKKTLYVGVFALILNNWQVFAGVVFESFAGLGLKATPTGLTPDKLLQPGFVAGTGYRAAYPLLEQAGTLLGFTTFFNNFVTIVVLLFAWLVVILGFFVLAVQLFITVIEFKLTTLAGFVLVPFALWNKTSFLAERVLGNVIASGVKVMVLAVILGIGTTLFSDFVTALHGREPSLEQAMSLVLASIALFGLGIFGPGIAAGLVSGAPQLGAGAAVGTVGGLAAGTLLAGGAAAGLARAGTASAVSAVRAGTALTSGASTAYGLGQATAGTTGLAGAAAGMVGVAQAGAGAAAQTARSVGERVASGFEASTAQGRQAAWAATAGPSANSAESIVPAVGGTTGAPDWARRLRAEQHRRAHLHATAQAVKEGDKPGASANPDLDQRD